MWNGATTRTNVLLVINTRLDNMTKSVRAYYHDDISALAKSLKKQLDSHGRIPGHNQLLHMLAKASGSQNYMSWQKESGNEASAIANLEVDSSRSRDIFTPQKDGTFKDFRKEPVDRLHAIIDINISIGRFEGALRCHPSMKIELVEEPFRDRVNRFFESLLLLAIEDLFAEDDLNISVFGDVELNLDSYASLTPSTLQPGSRENKQVRIGSRLAAKLRSEIELAKKSGAAFDDITNLLWEVLSENDPSTIFRSNPEASRALIKYLCVFIECQDSMYMTSWFNEKLGGLARNIENVLHGESYSIDDWQRVRSSIYSANAEPHWGKPLDAPPGLREALLTTN